MVSISVQRDNCISLPHLDVITRQLTAE
jgi:hypothetical protein